MSKLEELEQQLKSIQSEIDKLKQPKIENGWYKSNGSFGQEFILFYDYENKKRYGFDNEGIWYEDNCINLNSNLIPATESEVFEALKKEAIKRGFINGNKTEGFSKEGVYTINGGFTFDGKSLRVSVKGDYYVQRIIFEDGKWAEIIKDEPIKIGSYKVEKIEHGGLQIGCKKMNVEQILNIKKFMEKYKFTKVSFDGIETDLETINKILNL